MEPERIEPNPLANIFAEQGLGVKQYKACPRCHAVWGPKTLTYVHGAAGAPYYLCEGCKTVYKPYQVAWELRRG
jgi:hypothetical protein